ncbi:YitT family protein [Acetobacter sp. DsW_063]|uniref:YitT family protein n=1 Tax=Acetobacter sp. DsW_063 TaxID=1514894 RepID=UPI000A376387|nr:YitT family protein [Acetobacter sp. DsW_063]
MPDRPPSDTSPTITQDPAVHLPLRHTLAEDVYALLIGTSLITLGLLCLHQAGLVTGGVAGVALLISYVAPLSPGELFTLINIPFILFAIRAMGVAFAVKTAIVSCSITLIAFGFTKVIGLSFIQPLFAAAFGGTMLGMGVLSLARHQAGVGGTGVVTLWLQKTRGLNAGRSQLTLDAIILLCSLLVLPVERVLLSAVSAVALSVVLIAFHRPGRYIGY